MRCATGCWPGARAISGPRGLALLVMLTGCATAPVPADYEDKARGVQVPSRPRPTPSPPASEPRVEPPV
ncbi:hypothetical protein, partial [Archangium sp.]|uniref:hypothetical protein n=1 Tax=Archangium sp. TaxID=1872627 RepID=UPI002D273A63